MTPEMVVSPVDPEQRLFQVGYALAHSAASAMALVEGPDQAIQYANPAFCHFAKAPLGTLLGRSMAVCLPGHPQCASLLTRIYNGDTSSADAVHKRTKSQLTSPSFAAWPLVDQGGHSFGILLQVAEASKLQLQSMEINQALMLSAVRQHELVGSAARLAKQMAIEITRRKTSEAALRASQARLLLALEFSKASTWEWDIDTGRGRGWNKVRLLSGLGTTTREAPFRAWRSLVHPADRKSLDAVADDVTREGKELNFEFRLCHSRGPEVWMLARGRLANRKPGHSVFVSGMLLDITERKHSEQLLLNSEKLAGVGRLAATLAHEINNPLDAAMNAVYLLTTDPAIAPSAQKFLTIADEELRRVAHMTRQSLGFYREATQPTVFPISTLLDSVLGLLKNRIDVKSATIERQFEDALTVNGIFGELRQVFVNLVSNSLDALHAGGKITLRTSAAMPLADGKPRVRITVADNGKGIGAPQLTHIFEPFFTTKGNMGTGLGLWVTRQIVQQHGGTIQIHSSIREGHSGTVFSVLLPQ